MASASRPGSHTLHARTLSQPCDARHVLRGRERRPGGGRHAAVHSPTMKTATKYLTFELPKRRGLLRITDEVEAFCAESGLFYFEFDGRRKKRVILKALGA